MIRPLTPSDELEVARILKAVHATTAYPIGPLWSDKQIADECREFGWISDTAFILLRELPDAWEISFLATDPAAQKRGAMTQLLAEVVRQLPLGKSLWLEVHEGNKPARQFYERQGFRETGRRPRYYADGGAAVLYNYR